MGVRSFSLSGLSLIIMLSLFSITGSAELSAKLMKLTSPDISNGKVFQAQQMFNKTGCSGENKSPALSWSTFPKGTKSFAVTMHSPEKLSGKGFWNWVVINIPADVTGLKLNGGMEGNKGLPTGVSTLKNDYSIKGYSGPCPEPNLPATKYQITVYALDVPNLNINDNSTPAMASYYIKQHTLAKAVITASASRQ